MNICPLCDHPDPSEFVRMDSWNYVRCAACAFVFLDPMPSQAELNELYQQPADGPSEDPKARSRWRRAVLRALRLWPYLRGRRFIDVGCGPGFMTEASRLMGADAFGLDIDQHAIDYAKRRFPKCSFEAASFDRFQPVGTFDFVYSSELIEHVAMLGDYMDLIQRLTHPGSHVLITTPDIGSPRVPTNITQWDVFGPPYHVQFFCQQNLSLVFASYGFSPVRRLPDKKAGLKMIFRRNETSSTGGETLIKR